MKRSIANIAILSPLVFPTLALAHHTADHVEAPDPQPEVYVFKVLTLIGIAIATICILWALSAARPVHQFARDVLASIQSPILFIIRIATGASILYAAYKAAFAGTFILFPTLVGAYSLMLQGALFVIGFCCIIGLWTRASAALVIALSFALLFTPYVRTLPYAGFLSGAVIILVFGGGRYAIDTFLENRSFKRRKH